MKPLVQKLPLSEDSSFVTRTYRTPNFEVPWHQHIEYELILFTEGEGMSFIGNYVGAFATGDIFFLGANLPHTFQKKQNLITSAVVIQFKEDFWGNEFLALPESRAIKKLFETSTQGLKISGKGKHQLYHIIKELEDLRGFSRIIALCQCLSIIASDANFSTLSSQDFKEQDTKNKQRIDKVFQYTIDSFKKPISLSYIAGSIGMSIPAFCNYFKKSTKKTYTSFLNEVRIGYACNLLIASHFNINEICFESGFNTLANFNKQFLKIKGSTPSAYRNQFRNQAVNASLS
jgi:AraC-like DNA-binding protein/quercetin dioxygenase-like cupin family protein